MSAGPLYRFDVTTEPMSLCFERGGGISTARLLPLNYERLLRTGEGNALNLQAGHLGTFDALNGARSLSGLSRRARHPRCGVWKGFTGSGAFLCVHAAS